MLKGKWCCFKGLPSKSTSYVREKCDNSLLWDAPVERAKGDVARFKAFLECNRKVEK